jgi:hypothetical protein
MIRRRTAPQSTDINALPGAFLILVMLSLLLVMILLLSLLRRRHVVLVVAPELPPRPAFHRPSGIVRPAHDHKIRHKVRIWKMKM